MICCFYSSKVIWKFFESFLEVFWEVFWEVGEVKEVITPYGRSGSLGTIVFLLKMLDICCSNIFLTFL